MNKFIPPLHINNVLKQAPEGSAARECVKILNPYSLRVAIEFEGERL